MKHAFAVVLLVLAPMALADDLRCLAPNAEGARELPLVSFDVASSGTRAPSEITIQLRASDGRQCTWTATPGPQRMRVAEGTYALAIDAPGHRRIARDVIAGTNAGRIVLEHIPSITGLALGDGKPLANAIILSPNAKTLAVTDVSGAFRAAIDGDWPEHLEIQAPGFATRFVEIPSARADVELPAIELHRGGSLRVTVEGVSDARVILHGRGRSARYAERTIDAEHAIAQFDDLEEKRYSVSVRGKGPLQRLMRVAEVKAGQTTELVIAVVPAQLRLTTYLGETRLANASVQLQHGTHRWEETIKTDARGELAAELWQQGEFVLSVTSAEMPVPYLDFIELHGVDEITEEIRLPDRRITGRVVDAKTGAPIAAELQLTSTRDRTIKTNLRSVADTTGAFTFHAVPAAHHTLTARADGYVESHPLDVPLGESDTKREVTFRLARGVSRALEIVSATGAPLPGARVAELAGSRLLRIWDARPDGTLDYSIAAGETRTLVVVPREGSFAVTRVRANEPGPLRIVVPPGDAMLDLTTKVTGDGRMPPVHFLLRYNGETFPWEIGQLLEKVQGLRLSLPTQGTTRLANLPAGFYELWPVATPKEANAILGGTAPQAPVQVEVRPGLNSATLHFAAASRGNAP